MHRGCYGRVPGCGSDVANSTVAPQAVSDQEAVLCAAESDAILRILEASPPNWSVVHTGW